MLPEYWNPRPEDKPLYLQLYESLRNSISAGHAAPGERLPSIRKLSEELKISRTTVEAAYQQLCVEGYLVSRPQSGYFAADLLPGPQSRLHHVPAAPPSPAVPAKPAAVRYRFSTSAVDVHAFRMDLWRRYLRNVLNEPGGLLSYGEPQGELSLREAVAGYSGRVRDVSATPERIVIGAGIQPLLLILCGLLRNSEQAIGMEAPGFAQAEQIFADCGLRVQPLESDAEGLSMASLTASGVSAVYVNPSNRKLSGTPVPMKRRLELLEWSRRGGLLIEDDNNGELRYRSRPVPAMQGIDAAANVVYLGTFSKVLMPAVRIGYMVLPESLAEKYRLCRENYNQTASKTEQLALAQYIREGQLERQLHKMRKLYGIKGDLLMSCLHRLLPEAELILQETALRVLVRPRLGKSAVFLAQAALQNGVYVRPYGADGEQISVGFSGIAQEEIAAGAETLCLAWKRACRTDENLLK